MANRSETFHCPHCRIRLKKSPGASMLGEMQSGIVFGSMPPSVTCPSCGGAIDTQKMIAGEYDPQNSLIGLVIAIVSLGGVFWLCSKNGFGVWASIGISYAALIGIGLLLGAALSLRRKSRS